MPRSLCIGQENNHYEGACTNVMPMLVHPNLLGCLSLPILLNADASVSKAGALKGTKEAKETYDGVSPDGKTIIREIKTTFDDDNLPTYRFGVPKAQTKLPDEIPSSLEGVMEYNDTARDQRRASTVVGSASAVSPTYSITNDALAEIESAMRSIVTSSPVLNSPLESTENTETIPSSQKTSS